MAFDTYADLQTTIATWLRRSDMAAVIPDLIALAEASMQRELETAMQRLEQTLTIGSEFIDQPTGYKHNLGFRLTSSVCNEILEWSPDEMSAAKATPAILQNYPQRFSNIGGQFEFWPIPNGSYTAKMTFQAGFTPLSSVNPSNWILAGHPDAYLYGALSLGSGFAKNFDNASVWKSEFDRVIGEIQYALRTSVNRKLRVDPGIRQRSIDRTFNYLTGGF